MRKPSPCHNNRWKSSGAPPAPGEGCAGCAGVRGAAELLGRVRGASKLTPRRRRSFTPRWPRPPPPPPANGGARTRHRSQWEGGGAGEWHTQAHATHTHASALPDSEIIDTHIKKLYPFLPSIILTFWPQKGAGAERLWPGAPLARDTFPRAS